MGINMGCIQVGFWYYGIYHGVLCSHHGFHDFLIWGHIILAEQLEGILLIFDFDSFLLFIINHFLYLRLVLSSGVFRYLLMGTPVYYGIFFCSS